MIMLFMAVCYSDYQAPQQFLDMYENTIPITKRRKYAAMLTGK